MRKIDKLERVKWRMRVCQTGEENEKDGGMTERSGGRDKRGMTERWRGRDKNSWSTTK